MTAVTLIHNPRAGIQPIAPPTAIALVGRAGHHAHYVSARRTTNLLADLMRRRGLVAVAGGDGTVAEVLRAGKDLPLNVAIIPSGVANNIARSLGISEALPEVVTAWRRSRALPVHLAGLEVDRRKRLVVESIGLGALAIAARTMPHRKTSSFARRQMLVETRRHFRQVLTVAPPMSGLTIDGKPVASRPLFAEILNIPFTGPNLCLAREAGLDEGDLHLVYATEDHRAALTEWLDNGAHAAALPALPTLRAKTFTVEWADGPLRIDDEVTSKKAGRLTVAIHRMRIRLLAPH